MAPTALTPKQQEIYDLLGAETDPKEIANALHVSKAAIYSHIRAIKEAGHKVPAKYANVGVGRGGGRKPAASRRAPRKSAAAEVMAIIKPDAKPLSVAPEPAPGVSVDAVFAGLREQIARDVHNIEVRRTEITASVETLSNEIAKLQDEDGDLELALARLRSTEVAISADPAPVPAATNGKGKTKPAVAATA